jgi:ketosteroid isomerase-like protein
MEATSHLTDRNAMTPERAERLARDWLDAWNAHDLERILRHYADDVEFTSPFVAALLGDAGGTLRGRHVLRDYFANCLARYPALRFRLETVLAGVRSVTLYYESVNGLTAAEVMEIDADDRIVRVLAHYASRPARP